MSDTEVIRRLNDIIAREVRRDCNCREDVEALEIAQRAVAERHNHYSNRRPKKSKDDTTWDNLKGDPFPWDGCTGRETPKDPYECGGF